MQANEFSDSDANAVAADDAASMCAMFVLMLNAMNRMFLERIVNGNELPHKQCVLFYSAVR